MVVITVCALHARTYTTDLRPLSTEVRVEIHNVHNLLLATAEMNIPVSLQLFQINIQILTGTIQTKYTVIRFFFHEKFNNSNHPSIQTDDLTTVYVYEMVHDTNDHVKKKS